MDTSIHPASLFDLSEHAAGDCLGQSESSVPSEGLIMPLHIFEFQHFDDPMLA